MIIAFSLTAICSFSQTSDPRHLENGFSIYENGYIDQPYSVVLKDGRWLCVFTTGSGLESRPGQHVVSTISANLGKTWSAPVDIEPTTGPMASWAIPFITSFGRVYAFYDYNGDNVDSLNGKALHQGAELGWYCYKYSDDNGTTWSERFRLPLTKAPVDLNNDWKGEVQMQWGIDKPNLINGSMYFGFTRMGKFKMDLGEGWFFKSDNINTEKDATKIKWDLLPAGGYGVRNPTFGSIQEEHNMVGLNNGHLYCMYRTTQGFPANSYSADGGKTWSLPVPAKYDPNGDQIMKNPRACPMIWKAENGKYLFWYHNQGTKDFKFRNPAWISGGVEKNGVIYWSQPEILLYTNDVNERMSYPDLIEQKGKYWVMETNKVKGRVHQVDNSLLKGLWNQETARKTVRKGLVADKKDVSNASIITSVDLPDLKQGGFSIDLLFTLQDLESGQLLVDSRDESGKGITVSVTPDAKLRLQISDGKMQAGWDTDGGLLNTGNLQHVTFIVDGAPDIISVVVNGQLCNGGVARDYGWTRFSQDIRDVNSGKPWKLAANMHGQIKNIKVYNRYLRTSEAVSNYRAFMQ
jgi:hypothetical protein